MVWYLQLQLRDQLNLTPPKSFVFLVCDKKDQTNIKTDVNYLPTNAVQTNVGMVRNIAARCLLFRIANPNVLVTFNL